MMATVPVQELAEGKSTETMEERFRRLEHTYTVIRINHLSVMLLASVSTSSVDYQIIGAHI